MKGVCIIREYWSQPQEWFCIVLLFMWLIRAHDVAYLILCDKAVVFPNLYKKYCSFAVDFSPLPRYCVLYIGMEFGTVMSLICKSKRIVEHSITHGATSCDVMQCSGNNKAGAPLGNICSSNNNNGSWLYTSIDKIIQQIQELMASYKENSIPACSFDPDAFVECVDAELWDAFSSFAQSSSGKHGWTQSDPHSHVKGSDLLT